MRGMVVGVAFALLVTPAMAEWQMVDASNDEVEAYKAYVVDHTGAIELQFYCDDDYPGLLDMTVYTAETYDKKANYPSEGELAVLVDGVEATTVTAFFSDHENELLIFTSDFDVEGIDDIARTMARAQNEIGLTYFDRNYGFPAENARSIIKRFLSTCPG